MSRATEPADDPTPLTAARLDLAVRVGWLMRTWREAGGVSLRDMSAGLAALGTPYSAATLSRVERQGIRSPGAMDGYATVLGLPAGTVRSGIDQACGFFRYAPVSGPEPHPPDLGRFTATCAAVLDVAEPGGGDWLVFARQHDARDGFGLPRALVVEPVRRLLEHLQRSAGLAAANRYVAAAILRRSAYADVVEEVARGLLVEPGAQVVAGLLPALLAQRPSRSLLRWFAWRLDDDSVRLARAASHSLQSMLVQSRLPLADWESLVPDVARAWEGAGRDPARREFLRELAAALPPVVQDGIRAAVPAAAPAAVPSPVARRPAVPAPEWSRSRRNLRYELARRIARDACARAGRPEEPLLARVVFEALFDPRGVRRSLGRVLVRASPFGPATVDALVAHARTEDDADVRLAALSVATDCYGGHEMRGTETWLGSDDPAEVRLAVLHEGYRGRALPDAAFARGLDSGEWSAYRTLQAAAAVGDARLAEVAHDPDRPREQREAARWWSSRTGLVVERAPA